MPETHKQVGKVTHFFPKISVAVVELSDSLKKGDRIKVEGHGQAFEQVVDSMQVEHAPVAEAKKGMAVGMKMAKECKPGDAVFRVA